MFQAFKEDICDYLSLRRDERKWTSSALKMQSLSLRRDERKWTSSALNIQSFWKTTLIRRRYLQIISACYTLQNWYRSSQIRSRFLKTLRRQRRESLTHYTRSHHVFARVTKTWIPDVPTQCIAMSAYKRFYNRQKRDDGNPYRLFQQGEIEINKDDGK